MNYDLCRKEIKKKGQLNKSIIKNKLVIDKKVNNNTNSNYLIKKKSLIYLSNLHKIYVFEKIINFFSFLVFIGYAICTFYLLFQTMVFKWIKKYTHDPFCIDNFFNFFILKYQSRLKIPNDSAKLLHNFFSLIGNSNFDLSNLVLLIILISFYYLSMGAILWLMKSKKRLYTMARVFAIYDESFLMNYQGLRHKIGTVICIFFLMSAWLLIPNLSVLLNLKHESKEYCLINQFIPIAPTNSTKFQKLNISYINFFIFLEMINFISNLFVVSLSSYAIYQGFYQKEFTRKELLVKDLKFIKDYLNKNIKKALHCDLFKKTKTINFSEKRFNFSLKDDIVSFTLTYSKKIYSLYFPDFLNKTSKINIKLNEVFKQINDREILLDFENQHTFSWMSFIMLFIFWSNLSSGLVLWIIFLLSSKMNTYSILVSTLIYLPLVFQAFINILRKFYPDYIKQKNAEMEEIKNIEEYEDKELANEIDIFSNLSSINFDNFMEKFEEKQKIKEQKDKITIINTDQTKRSKSALTVLLPISNEVNSLKNLQPLPRISDPTTSYIYSEKHNFNENLKKLLLSRKSDRIQAPNQKSLQKLNSKIVSAHELNSNLEEVKAFFANLNINDYLQKKSISKYFRQLI